MAKTTHPGDSGQAVRAGAWADKTDAPVDRAVGHPEARAATRPTATRKALRRQGWRVTAAATANQMIVSVPTFQGSSAIFAAVEAEFGWTRTTTSAAASFGSLAQTVTGPFMGAATDRFGSARMVLVGLLLAGTGFVVFSQLHGPGLYYAGWLLVSIGVSIGGFTPSIAAVNLWMSHRRSAAMSYVLAGGSAGALLVPLMAWGFTAFGWRPTVIAAGALIGASGPVIAWTMWRRPPGFERAGRTAAARPALGEGEYDFTPAQALRTRAFWAITGAHTLANFSVGVVSSQVVLHLQAVGLSLTRASLVIPVMGATAFAFQLVGGQIGDKMDKRLPASFFLAVQGAAVVVLAFTNGFPMAMTFAVIWGAGFGGRTPILHAMRGDFFGRRHYATIMSLSAVPMALGMTVMPVVAGRVFDVQHTYRWVFVGLAAACAAGAWVVMFATRPRPPAAAERNARAG